MRVARTASELDAFLKPARVESRSIGFVPTMGALHDGHLSLVAAARDACDVVVVSIFVNPLQFGPTEDLAGYPRDERTDVEALRAAGVDAVFLPSVEEMYPSGASTFVSVGALGEILEGEHRPGHFNGVCTVVAKFFNIVSPDVAFFGQKDAQQVAVIKKMVADLEFGVEIVVCPTIREPDGLAMSSRNSYLSGGDRRSATALYRALQVGRVAVESGRAFEIAEKEMRELLEVENGVDLDYARIVHPVTFLEPHPSGPVLLVVAARVGPARLIDNLIVEGVHASRD